jgi:hypothetical protein
VVDKVRQLATEKLQQGMTSYAGIPFNLTQKHLETISTAKDFWHPEDLFDEVKVIEDDEEQDIIGADEYSFYTIFDGLVDELFEDPCD